MDPEFVPLLFPSIQIPDSWTPEMACEVVDFLSDIIQAIWATHGSGMAQYLQRPTSPDSPALDDDFPF